MPRRTHRRILDTVLVAGFALALVAPTLDLGLRPADVRSVVRENRNPAPYPMPIRELFTLSSFPADFARWFDDRFGLRDVLLRGSQALRLFVMHCEASPTLIEGQHGWLYFGADNSVAVQRGMAPFTAAELQRWCADIESRRDWLRARGIEYAFVIAPNKQTIYPELMPDVLAPLGPTRLDQLREYLREHSDVRFVDLRGPLMAEKAHDAGDDCVYYPLGSHWSWRGGWVAWNAIVDSVSDVFPALHPIPREACVDRELPELAGDSMMVTSYIDDLVHQRAFAFEVARPKAMLQRDATGRVQGSEQRDVKLPATLVIHDSFGSWLLPFAAEGSSRMSAAWQHAFPKERIQVEEPDLVVQMYTERVLVWGLAELAPENDPLDAAAFETLRKLWGPLDLAAGPPLLTEGQVTVTPTAEGARIEQAGANGMILLPEADVPPGAQLCLHVDVTAPASSVLTFFYQLSHAPTFSRSRMARVVLDPGRNDVRFRLRMPDVRGPLKMRVGTVTGTYVLHALEARAAQ